MQTYWLCSKVNIIVGVMSTNQEEHWSFVIIRVVIMTPLLFTPDSSKYTKMRERLEYPLFFVFVIHPHKPTDMYTIWDTCL